jgi:predicted pyridoxine 5'-phosphate oxidase superfamily flavin-nucleotide-binding protein
MSNAAKNLSAVNLAFANSIVQQLDVLSARRDVWEKTEYKKANDGLYALLADCLDVFNARFVKGSEDDKKALRRSLMERLKANNVRVVATSTTLTMLARFVFNSDRKRAQGYGYVLAAAVSHGIEAAEFPAWVLKQGGIEEIKRKMVQSDEAKARQEKRKQAKETAEQMIVEAQVNPLATVSVDGFSPAKLNIMLAVGDVSGNFNVTYVLTEVSEGLYNALLKQAAKQIVAKQDEDDAVTAEAAKLKPQQHASNDQQMKKAA